MKKRSVIYLSLIVLLMFSLNLFAQEYSYDYKQMKMDEYRAELAKWQKREADAKAKIAEEEAKIAKLKEELASLDQQIEQTWNEIYALLGTDKAGYQQYVSDLKALQNEVSGFVALSPEEIYTRKDEITKFEERLAEFKKDKRSLTSESKGIIAQIEALIQQAKDKATPAAAGRYEVQPGDYLWKIAKMPEIYGNPYAWIRIYTYNRDQIKNPDLIYPNQVFRIPKVAGPNEHWVEKGEFLYKIAGYANVYGDPFKWQKIYEANKDVIDDPNMIYPFMVLTIPRD